MCSRNSDNLPLRLAVTGGIGSGKSYVCQRLTARGLPVFYCDAEAKKIIRTDDAVRQALTALVGADVYDARGALMKPVLAAYLCGGAAQAAQVDAIVHPRVAEAFRRWCRASAAPLVVMECALLYESGFDRLVDVTAHVVVPEDLRLQRVMVRDHVSREKALAWMALQLPEDEKARRADFLIHNATEERLVQDIDRLLDECRRRSAGGLKKN